MVPYSAGRSHPTYRTLLPEAWPPTGWFNNWATGRDLFPLAEQQPPMELRYGIALDFVQAPVKN